MTPAAQPVDRFSVELILPTYVVMTGTAGAEELRRRANDASRKRGGRLSRLGLLRGRDDSVAAGRLLLFSVGLVVTATAPLLETDRHSWLTLLAVTCAMTVTLLLSFVLPWKRLPDWSTLAFPALVFVAVGVLGFDGNGLGAPYGGVFVLCFAYTGLTQSPGVNVALIPFAAVAYVAAMDKWSTALGIRLLIVTSVWLLLSELLCAFRARNDALSAALRAAAYTDALTGVANRRDLDLRLTTTGATDTLVLCDLDFFKQYNDVHGHISADRVLVNFGELLRSCLREQDYAARYGGEEFVLILAETNPEQATAVTTRLRQAWSVLQPDITFSSGIAQLSRRAPSNVLLKAADQALYRAKAAGRNCDRIQSLADQDAFSATRP